MQRPTLRWFWTHTLVALTSVWTKQLSVQNCVETKATVSSEISTIIDYQHFSKGSWFHQMADCELGFLYKIFRAFVFFCVRSIWSLLFIRGRLTALLPFFSLQGHMYTAPIHVWIPIHTVRTHINLLIFSTLLPVAFQVLAYPGRRKVAVRLSAPRSLDIWQLWSEVAYIVTGSSMFYLLHKHLSYMLGGLRVLHECNESRDWQW